MGLLNLKRIPDAEPDLIRDLRELRDLVESILRREQAARELEIAADDSGGGNSEETNDEKGR